MNDKQAALIIYTDGTYERKVPLTGGQQMQIGQGLIDDVRNAIMPMSEADMPAVVKQEQEQGCLKCLVC
jgi:hypothetical protein